MHLDFRQLRNFVALVEYGSFNRAAEAVCLSQSAFSRSIQALEQSVGHPLFDRQSKLPTLTLHGQKLLPYARREADSAASGEFHRLLPQAVPFRLITGWLCIRIRRLRRAGVPVRRLSGG
jgi:DNA-binding transcriptional LysR family regulator